MILLRVPLGLIKGEQLGLGLTAVSRETSSNGGAEPLCRDLAHAQQPGQQRGKKVGMIYSHSPQLTD